MPRMHRKTRTGCAQCKRRRVKVSYCSSQSAHANSIQCDERKPSCANCDRNSLPCSLEFLTPMNSFLARNRANANITAVRATYPCPPRLKPELSPSIFDGRTNELLHHYTTHVCASLSGHRSPSVWQVDMPQLALAHPFLLSGILAISALHLSTVSSHRRRKLQTLAIALETAALPSFRQSMNSPNAVTIHATFAFAGTVIFYMMMSPEVEKVNRCRLPTRDDDHPHWFLAVRGVVALLASNWAALEKGPFAPLLHGDTGPSCALDNPNDEELAKLEGMFPPLLPLKHPYTTSSLSPSSPLSRETSNIEICKVALDKLRRVSAIPYSLNGTLCIKASAHMWPGVINQDFLDLIYEKYPRALVILAYYCVMLKRNNHLWYLKGLGTGLLESIWDELGDEWRPWIQRAVDQPEC